MVYQFETIKNGDLMIVVNDYLVRAYKDLLQSGKDEREKRQLNIKISLNEVESGKVNMEAKVTLKLPSEIPDITLVEKGEMSLIDGQLQLFTDQQKPISRIK